MFTLVKIPQTPQTFFRLLGALLFALSGLRLAAQSTISATDTTGWTPWTLGSGSVVMSDPQGDQQTGQGQDDFVGDASTYAMTMKSGQMGGSDYVLFQARFNTYTAEDQWGNGGNLGIGMDIDGNGSVDLIMMFSEGSGKAANRSRTIQFGLPGTNANTSPSTTSWTFPTQTAINLTVNADYNCTLATTGTNFGGNSDAWLTFGVSFANLQNAIRTYAKETTTGQYSNYTFDYNSHINYIAFTSTQDNALNQDLAGTSGNTSASTTWAQLGAISAPMSPTGYVPEPATYAQVGILLAIGGVLLHRRRRRPAVAGAADGAN